MPLAQGVEDQIVEALRDRRVTRLVVDPDGRVSMIWHLGGPGGSQAAINGVPLADLLGAILRRCAV